MVTVSAVNLFSLISVLTSNILKRGWNTVLLVVVIDRKVNNINNIFLDRKYYYY